MRIYTKNNIEKFDDVIRLFKQMKDYIAAENAPDVSAGMVALATQTSQN